MSDEDGRDPEPTEYFPPFPTEREDTTGTELPPIGTERDPDPTRVLPPPGPGAGPTEPLPPVGGPYDPGPPYDGGGGGGGGDDGGDDFDDEPEPEPWWRQPGPLAALIAGLAALILGVIALIVWAGDGDDSSDDTLPVLPTSSTLPASTVVSTSSTVPETTTTTTTTVPETTTTTTTTTTTPPTTTTTTTPPTTTTTTAPPTTTTTTIPVVTVPDPGGTTAWDVIANSPDLSEMRGAIQQAGLVDLFNSDGPLTALASSNTVFQNLRATPAGEELLDDPERLAAVLRRQVIVEAVSAAEFPGRGELQSAATPEDCELLGADEDCGVLEGGGDAENPTVDGASFLVTDVDAANGLLDVIDRVLVP
jgi:uncharacterized surface protein with fasciclin (FAS1) repeats